MAEIVLTQDEADTLIAVEKQRIDDTEWDYPGPGERANIPLASADGREQFYIDISRGRINLAKGTYQNRARQVVVLVRLDYGGAPHRNPDDQEVASPHIHLYREGYGDKWAYPIPAERFPNIDQPWETLLDFMRYCNVTQPPNIRKGLFT